MLIRHQPLVNCHTHQKRRLWRQHGAKTTHHRTEGEHTVAAAGGEYFGGEEIQRHKTARRAHFGQKVQIPRQCGIIYN